MENVLTLTQSKYVVLLLSIEPVVYIHEKDTPVANVTTKQIAFHLVCGNSYYSIKVDGTDLKVKINLYQ